MSLRIFSVVRVGCLFDCGFIKYLYIYLIDSPKPKPVGGQTLFPCLEDKIIGVHSNTVLQSIKASC